MTLIAWLDSLRVDPADSTSARLFVALDDLTPAQEGMVKAVQEPYAVILGLPGNRNRGLHDGSSLMTSLIDIMLLQPPKPDGTPPGRAKLRRLAAHTTVNARHNVTALPGVTLTQRLALATETPVTVRPEDKSIWCTIRFRAFYHRH